MTRTACLVLLSMTLFMAMASSRRTYPLPSLPSTMRVLRRANSSTPVALRLHLQQRNVDLLRSLFDRVSDPTDSMYAHYMTREEIEALTSPRPEVMSRVVAHLESLGLAVTPGADFVSVSGSVKAVEALLDVPLHEVFDTHHRVTKVRAAVTNSFTLPDEIAPHVELVTGVTDRRVKVRLGDRRTRHPRPKSVASQPSQSAVIPQTMVNNYRLSGYTVTTNASQNVIEFESGLYYLPSDLSAFSTGVGLSQQANPVTKIGKFETGSSPDGESTLDIEMITALGVNGTNYFQVTGNWLLDVAQQLMAMENPPLVNSMSWSSDERQEGLDFNQRVDDEYRKLGLRGVTMLGASGDSGAVGTGSCSGNSHVFNPGYPAASAAAVSVGATMLVSSETMTEENSDLPPACRVYECALQGVEQPADLPDGDVGDGFATGGGFSVFNSLPSWQRDAVQAYLNDDSIPKPPSSAFNASNRAFPDVAALGNNIMIYQSGSPQLTGGTSASTPEIGGIISLINSFLMSHGRAPVGFVNPLFYKMAAEEPSTFVSIGDLSTNNKDGCEHGYVSNPKGYDPVTGLGVPNLHAIISYITAHLDMFPAARA